MRRYSAQVTTPANFEANLKKKKNDENTNEKHRDGNNFIFSILRGDNLKKKSANHSSPRVMEYGDLACHDQKRRKDSQQQSWREMKCYPLKKIFIPHETKEV